MSGVSLGKSHGKPRTARKTLRRCNNGVGADHVILIDVESDTFSDVIFIDEPESIPNNVQGNAAAKKDKRSPLRNIICIDDDESNENEYAEFGIEDNRQFFHDLSPSMRSCSTSKSGKQPLNEVGDDCQFVREKVPPVKLSKCKRTYSGKAPVRSRYGLTSDSESSSSDNDEIMEDYSGQLRDQWQKASLKRKNDIRGQTGCRYTNSASGVGAQPEPHENEEHPTCSGYSKSSRGKEDLSPESTSKSRCTSGMADAHDERDPHMENFEEGCPSMSCEYQQIPFEEKHSEQGNQGSVPAAGPSLEKPLSRGGEKFSCRRYREAEEERPLGKRLHAVETENGQSRCISANNSKKCQDKAKNDKFHFPKESRHETSSFKEKEGLFSGEFPRRKRSSVEHYPDHRYSNDGISLRESPISTRAFPGSGISCKKCVDQENEKRLPDRTSEFCGHHHNEPQPRSRGSLLVEDLSDSVSMDQHKDERHDDVNGQDGENVGNCIITERERIKETSEYKKALEEELASRQRALAIQAEEARKMKLLLKRKKAESMRLLEMEKRQKQRVEEMRETQKKDVENMNLKELIRADTQKELIKLEMTCHDMASILRGLGITVGGGTYTSPSSHEVRVAYKKALLTFHPDRASKSDIRQQVQAEEKFKLISRMKDKYLKNL